MPGWSPEIAKEFVRLGEQDGVAFTQGKLQKLVYIAHGWCLADTGRPLTGDRPEAWVHGPVYRRLADALVACGIDEVHVDQLGHSDPTSSSELDAVEQAMILKVYKDHGGCDAASLAALTRHGDAPWGGVFIGGAGRTGIFRTSSSGTNSCDFPRSTKRKSDIADHSDYHPLTGASAGVLDQDDLAAAEDADWLDRQLRHRMLTAQIRALEQDEKRRNSALRQASWHKAITLALASCAF